MLQRKKADTALNIVQLPIKLRAEKISDLLVNLADISCFLLLRCVFFFGFGLIGNSLVIHFSPKHTNNHVMIETSNRTTPITCLCTFPVALVGFTQTLSGLLAATGRVKGCHHLASSITQSPLYTISIVQFFNLEMQTLQKFSAFAV